MDAVTKPFRVLGKWYSKYSNVWEIEVALPRSEDPNADVSYIVRAKAPLKVAMADVLLEWPIIRLKLLASKRGFA